tara:strand:+ start:3047 stop:3229 length:183 start_codon:yes stop_codon:yes gene_type:complete
MSAAQTLIAIAVAAAPLLLFIASSMSYADAVQAESAYCDSVESGLYPDYHGNYQEVCRNE